ncbi:unnamed protein product [Cyclocybe aegerita]|uniref:DUF7719 domain-containing protein n=1 Tax=Cyclocybe aegerita TaxID=1973307 RepID=A0A8S0VWS1_CYCAE|nr:unnamed protein product [Cyclocybe aegerita]
MMRNEFECDQSWHFGPITMSEVARVQTLRHPPLLSLLSLSSSTRLRKYRLLPFATILFCGTASISSASLMARGSNALPAGKASGSIPLTAPSKAPKKRAPQKPLIEISEEEQWRIINQTRILESSELQAHVSSSELPEGLSLSDEIFNAILLIIPFSSLLLLMEILIRHQYGKTASLEVILDRMLPGVPVLSVFIFYTIRYKRDWRLQLGLSVLSVVVGSRMLYLFNHASWLVNMKQVGSKLLLDFLQLDLIAAMASLAVVGGFVWWNDLKILL